MSYIVGFLELFVPMELTIVEAVQFCGVGIGVIIIKLERWQTLRQLERRCNAGRTYNSKR